MRIDCDAYEYLCTCVCTVCGICEAIFMCTSEISDVSKKAVLCMCVYINVTGLETGCKADLFSVTNERLHILPLFTASYKSELQ